MSDIIYGNELLNSNSPGVDYEATTLMLSGHPHKIFITPEQRDDTLEGFSHGFVIEINNKRIGCYWEHDNEFEISEDNVKVWNLAEIGIEPSMSSTNQFTDHRFFSSDDELREAVSFIKRVFKQFDGAESTAVVDGEVVMVWTKKRESDLHISDALQAQIESGELVQGREQ